MCIWEERMLRNLKQFYIIYPWHPPFLGISHYGFEQLCNNHWGTSQSKLLRSLFFVNTHLVDLNQQMNHRHSTNWACNLHLVLHETFGPAQMVKSHMKRETWSEPTIDDHENEEPEPMISFYFFSKKFKIYCFLCGEAKMRGCRQCLCSLTWWRRKSSTDK